MTGQAVLVNPQASPVVVADDQDPDFLAAINGQDDAIELPADDLANLRRYVLRGGEPPSRKPEPEESSPGVSWVERSALDASLGFSSEKPS